MVERTYYAFKFNNTLCGVLRSSPIFLVLLKAKFTASNRLFVRNMPPDVWLYSGEAFC